MSPKDILGSTQSRQLILIALKNYVDCAHKYHIMPILEMIADQAIKEPLLRELIGAAEVVTAVISGRQQGFAIVFRVGDTERTLETSRGSVRLFASLDTAAAFVRGLGIARFEVDMSSHQPGRLRPARPDRAEALRQTRTKLRQQPLGFENVGTV